MEIKLCEITSDLPPDHEVRDIIKVVCERANLDFDRIHLSYIGGKRRKNFPRRGIKLMRPCQWSVQLYIGCNSETVESHLSVLDAGRRSRPGNEVFDKLNRICINRVFCVADELVRQARLAQNGSYHHTESVSVTSDLHKTEEFRVADVVHDPTASAVAHVSAASLEVSKEQDEVPHVAPATDEHFPKYFDDPSKLHLAVCALVALANEDCQAPFSFELVERALKESDVPSTAGLPMSLMKAFLSRGFMVRINPGCRPPRYQITTDALAFVHGPIPKATVKTVRQKVKPSADEESLAKSAERRAIQLRQIFYSHEKTVSELNAKRVRLSELHKRDIGKEESNIDSEVKSLQRRLQALAEERLSLAKLRSEIASMEEQIEVLQKEVNDPETKKAIVEFEKLRKLVA